MNCFFAFRTAENSAQLSDEYIAKVLEWSLNRIDKLPDLFSPNLAFIWTLPSSYNVDEKVANVIPSLKNELGKLNEINREHLNVLLREISKNHDIKYGNFMKSLRGILSELKVSFLYKITCVFSHLLQLMKLNFYGKFFLPKSTA